MGESIDFGMLRSLTSAMSALDEAPCAVAEERDPLGIRERSIWAELTGKSTVIRRYYDGTVLEDFCFKLNYSYPDYGAGSTAEATALLERICSAAAERYPSLYRDGAVSVKRESGHISVCSAPMVWRRETPSDEKIEEREL